MQDTNKEINLNYITGETFTYTYYSTGAATLAEVWFGYTSRRSIGNEWTEIGEGELERVDAEAAPIIEELRELIVNPHPRQRIEFTDEERALELTAKLDALLETIEIEHFDVAVYGESEHDGDIEQLAAEAVEELPANATEAEKIEAIETALARMAADITRDGDGVTFRYEVEDWDALFEALNGDEDEDEDDTPF